MRDYPHGERRRHCGNRCGIWLAVRSRGRAKHFWDSSCERFIQTSSAIERQQPFLLREQRYYLNERLHAGDTAGCGPKKSFLTGWTPLELRCKGGIGIQTGLGRETSKSSEKICHVSWCERH